MFNLLDNSPVGLAIVSSETRERIFTNRQLVKMFGGTSTDDLQARRIRDSWVDPERYLEAEKLLEAGKNLVNFRAERYRLDGSKWWAMMNSHFMVFDGIPARAVWHSDITEMVEARSAIEKINNDLEERVQIRTRELQETKERFRGYAEIASDWFWEMDSELRYTFISGAYQKYTGRPPERIIGRSRREMYKGQFPEERDTWMAFLDTLDAHRDFENFTYS
jgi:PAS domain S-box-containing protein